MTIAANHTSDNELEAAFQQLIRMKSNDESNDTSATQMNLLKASIIEMYTTNPSNVTQILHLTEELKVSLFEKRETRIRT
jgi:hypothetical protein